MKKNNALKFVSKRILDDNKTDCICSIFLVFFLFGNNSNLWFCCHSVVM